MTRKAEPAVVTYDLALLVGDLRRSGVENPVVVLVGGTDRTPGSPKDAYLFLSDLSGTGGVSYSCPVDTCLLVDARMGPLSNITII